MTALFQLTAAPTTITVGGAEYELPPLTLSDYGRLKKRILESRGDPIEIARKLADGLSEPERRRLFDRAYDDAMRGGEVPDEELDTFRTSPSGVRYTFYLSLRKTDAYKAITEDEAAAIADRYVAEQYEEYLRTVGRKAVERGLSEEAAAALVGGDVQQAMTALLDFLGGLPLGNSPTPAMEPGITETAPCDSSRGNGGIGNSPGSTDGATTTSDA